MDNYLKTILSNTLKHEAKHILEYEEDMKAKIERMNIIFNFQKIINNYDELEPVLKKFFTKKAEQNKWREKLGENVPMSSRKMSDIILPNYWDLL